MPVETIGDVIQPGRRITPVLKSAGIKSLDKQQYIDKFSTSGLPKNVLSYKKEFGKFLSMFKRVK